MNQSRFVIGAPTSNAGKTSISLAIMRALSKQEKAVQPFKCGPDYIDPKFHQLAARKESFNLDLIMMPEDHVKELWKELSSKAEVAVVEGVMGLFDGARKNIGSTAELAKTLDLPVVLVVDAKSVAYSVAPLIYGFKNFDAQLNIAGVIFNKVNTESHFRFLQEACEDVGVKCFGYVRRLEEVEIPSRHLGLSIAEIEQYDSAIETLADSLVETVDLEAVLSATSASVETVDTLQKTSSDSLTIAVAKDEAFNFIYAQSIRQFQRRGEVVFFSPLIDEQLPACDLLYLAGGYPECYLNELQANQKMRDQIKSYVEDGGKVLAECGGMMYLGRAIEDEQGNDFEMVGALNVKTSMKQRKLHLGYRIASWKDTQLMGHEFHYSSLVEDEVNIVGELKNIRGLKVPTKLMKEKGVLASYQHFYFGDDEQFERLYKWIKESV